MKETADHRPFRVYGRIRFLSNRRQRNGQTEREPGGLTLYLTYGLRCGPECKGDLLVPGTNNGAAVTA